MPRTMSGSTVCGRKKYPSPRATRLRKKSAQSHQARRPRVHVSFAASWATSARPRQVIAVMTLVEQPVPDDVVQGGGAIPPGDLLTFGVRASVVADRHLVDAATQLGDLDGHLGLEAEAVGAQREPLQHVGPERLVADFHVGQVEAGH